MRRSFVSTGAILFLMATLLLLSFSGSALAQKKKKKLPSQKFKGYGGLPEAVRKAPQALPPVVPVQSNRRSECREMAAKIDAMVEANLAKHSMTPNSPQPCVVHLFRLEPSCF